MSKLDWLKPETWVQRVGGDVQPAYQDPAIQNILNKGGPDSSLQCPHCRIALAEIHYEGLRFAKGAQCGGILATEIDVQRAIIREDVGFSEKVIHMSKTVYEMRQQYLPPLNRLKGADLLACPRCREPKPRMLKMFFSLAYPVEVERCNFCQSVWLDKDELEVIQYLIIRHAACEVFKNIVHRNTRALYARLSAAYGGIKNNAILKGHMYMLLTKRC